MIKAMMLLAGSLVLVFPVACGSADEGGGDGAGAAADAQVADLSQFPTPTRSQAAPQPEPTQPVAAAAVQTQAEQGGDDSEAAEVEPMSQEELQQLRQQLQSGELSAEEQQEAIERLRAQFGGGQGGQGGFGGGGGGGTQAVGSIESISGSTIAVTTELATISANVGENANIRITSILEPTALTEGTQVIVVSERVEGSTLARVITVVPEGQGGFGRRGAGGGQGGQGAFGGGQGGQGGGGTLPLFGTIESIADSGFTLETQQGPFPIATNDETVIIQTAQGALADLEVGMQVGVFGTADEEGTIEARTIAVTPEGLEDIAGLGGGLAGRGRGGGGLGGGGGGN
ncbi:MAG: DUF5666 domain-containing protein [Chloroflexi bacterium]|nr:DUF5666 domain-containing protein [Chloroflexota bacterium]